VSGSVYWFICTNAAYPAAIPVVAGSQLEYNRRVANGLAGLSKTRHEVGDLMARPVSDPVNNHLLCDGSAISRTGFPQLFKVIGTTWGVVTERPRSTFPTSSERQSRTPPRHRRRRSPRPTFQWVRRRSPSPPHRLKLAVRGAATSRLEAGEHRHRELSQVPGWLCGGDGP
jgi:hypothetical protein